MAHSSLSTKAMAIASCSLRSAGAQLMKKELLNFVGPEYGPTACIFCSVVAGPTVHMPFTRGVLLQPRHRGGL